MADRETALNNLAVGDVFHAESPNAPSMICLVMAVAETRIQVRTVTHQNDAEKRALVFVGSHYSSNRV